jgi:two-component system, sensor histidine kinase and response regulator
MRILIVDDIEINRKLLRVNLEAEGIQTFEASDGIEALMALEHQKADAIISDILMPHMDGYQLCQKIRKDSRFEHLPFIFYTSTYTSPGDEKLAINCGADRYIRKPASIDVIKKAIEELSDPRQRHPKSKPKAEEGLVMLEYNAALVRKLEERNEKLESARAEIAFANEQLERRVQERTAELLVANQELEAFSHSIAHDLRSPLTAIALLSDLLFEECEGKVSARATDALRFISEAVSRMNQLTADLLRLASANRAEMSSQKVDLSALAAATLQELRETETERSLEFVTAPGIMAVGDHGLLRIALENLLGNAWKYSGKTAHPRIEFGVEQRDGAPAFFVRDNGAGFDMASADKLFTTFCRLHSTAEFPGVGIGLSTVHRIIARHGGRIWAEAAVNRGATFFFTIGEDWQTTGQ